MVIGERHDLVTVGDVANEVAARHVFGDYQSRKPQSTLTAQRNDLRLFGQYLGEAGMQTDNLFTTPAAWAGITWGLIEGFKRWSLQQGYAIASINRALSTIKLYVKLAFQAGVLAEGEQRKIKSISGYRGSEGRNIDEKRPITRIPRINAKKSTITHIGKAQARELKQQGNDTPVARRNTLIMCLLLDHGLRVSEVVDLNVSDFHVSDGTFSFYRHKTDRVQQHTMSSATLNAARAYFRNDALAVGPLLRASLKNGELDKSGMSAQALNALVGKLGRAAGLARLSPHDCRHFWASAALRNGSDLASLQHAGGWASPAMPLRYAEERAIANEGIRLDDE